MRSGGCFGIRDLRGFPIPPSQRHPHYRRITAAFYADKKKRVVPGLPRVDQNLAGGQISPVARSPTSIDSTPRQQSTQGLVQPHFSIRTDSHSQEDKLALRASVNKLSNSPALASPDPKI